MVLWKVDRNQSVSRLVISPPLTLEGFPLVVRHPPLMALYIASLLLARRFNDFVVCDWYFLGKEWEVEAAKLSGQPCRRILLELDDYDRPHDKSCIDKFIQRLKTYFPRADIAVASADSSMRLMPHIRSSGIIFINKQPIELLAARWLLGHDFRADDEVSTGISGTNFLDCLPYPAWQIVDIGFYNRAAAPHRYKRKPFLPLLAARGCPFSCSFCDKFLFGTGTVFTPRDPSWIVEEIKFYQRSFGIREVQFAEPLFNADNKWAKMLCSKLARICKPICFSCHVRLDLMDEELLSYLKFAGCWNILFGVESGDELIRCKLGKHIKLEQAKTMVRKARQLGIQTTASFVLGLPGETIEGLLRTVAVAVELNPTYCQFFVHKNLSGQAIPAALGKTEDNWTVQVHDIPGPVFVPSPIGSKEILYDVRSYAYKKFYIRTEFVRNFVANFSSCQDIPRILAGFGALARLTLQKRTC